MMEILTGLLGALSDPASLLPDLPALFEKLVGLIRVAVYAGPAALILLGLMYYFLAPKEANHHFGFRCWWGMSSVEVWQFTQKLAGIVWSILGFTLCIVMTVQSGKFRGMEADTMAYLAMKYLLLELACVVGSIILINLTVFVCFNRKGILREFLRRDSSKRKHSGSANRR